MRELDRLKLAVEAIHGVAYEWDPKRDKFAWSGDVCALFGVDSATELESTADVSNIVIPQDKEHYVRALVDYAENVDHYERVFQVVSKDKKIIPVLDQGMVLHDEKGVRLVGMLSSSPFVKYVHNTKTVSEKKASSSKIDAKSTFHLAELRTAVADIYAENRENGTNSVLLRISVDNLPMMISWYSLDFANRIMAALEVNISNLLRDEDVLHRIGMDQLGVVLKNHSQSEAELVVDRMLQAIQLYTNPSFEEPIHLRCSIGSVHFPHNITSVDDALNKSFLALNTTKSKSNAFHCDYEDAKRDYLDSKDEITKLNYLQRAMVEERMQVAYQPIVSGADGSVYSYECLMRIADEGGNLQSAGPLIPVAEKLGMIDILDHFMMEKILVQLRQYPDIRLGFNISNLTTDNPKWLKTFTKMLDDEQLASRVIVEITETAAQHDMRQTAYFVAALQALGCKVALDDFGAGYTSFRQLKALSVDTVKIDGAYVRGLPDNTENSVFIKMLIEFNQSYGVTTVAECIETGEQAKALIDLGVDYMQGYYFGKPESGTPWLVD